MDTSALRRAVDDLAASFSEITHGDLALPTAAGGRTLGELYRDIIERTALAGAVDAQVDPAPSPAGQYGTGYERAYRRIACGAIDAIATRDAADALLHDTIGWTAEVDRVLELEC